MTSPTSLSRAAACLFRPLALALLCALAVPTLPAQAPATGSVSGRVLNEATGQYLNNARISIKGTGIEAFTDETGTFRISGVPSGATTIEAFYSGLDPIQASVEIRPGQNTERDISLTNKAAYGSPAGGTVKLDAFVLSASKMTEGESLATNEQRFAANIKNVVATDAFGDVTEGNVAEFMKFLPGVTVEYSDASPNAVAIRGFDPNMTAVSVDGSQLANASGSAANRSFLFTQVSINNTSRIEVTKVPTPANPADGISGTVNMVSKSAFERSRAQFNYRVFVSASSDGMQLAKQPYPTDKLIYRWNPGLDFDYTLPITKNFGIVFTGLTSKQWNEQNISTMTWNTNAAGTGATPQKPYLQSHQIVDAPKWYERHSTSLKADWRMTPNSVLSLSTQATYYVDKNGNNSRTETVGTNPTPTPATGTRFSYDEDDVIGATGRGGVTFAGNFIHIAARTLGSQARYRYDSGDWHLDAGTHWSTSKTWRRYHENGSFQSLNSAMAVPVRVEFHEITDVRPNIIRVFDNNNRELDINDPNNYRLNTVSSTDYRDHKEDVFGGDANVKRRFSVFEVPTNVQVGTLYRVQERDRRSYNRAWNYNGMNGDFTPTPFVGQIYSHRPNYFRFNDVPWTSSNEAVEAWKKNPGLFTQTPAQLVAQEQSRIVGSEKISEIVTAFYAQTEAKFFQNRLTLLTGVRYEKTHDKGEGPLNEPGAAFVRNADGTFAHNAQGQRIRRPEAGDVGSMEELRLTRRERANRANRSYDGYYPSLHLTYNVTPNFLLRAAYAKTYGRPDFAQIVPNATITENDVVLSNDPNAVPGDISVRNIALKPWKADNYDLSAEYYTDNGGLFTAGVFRKDIKDFFGTLQTIADADILDQLGLDPRYAGWRLNTTVNSGDARVSGVEFNVRQSLTPLGKWGRYLSVFANATKLDLQGSRTADFNRFLPKSMNWGFTFTKNPITFMAKWHHRGEQNRGLATAQGPNAIFYQDARTTLDVNVSYQAFRRLSVFVNGRNVTNEWFTQSRYQADTPAYARRSSTNSYGVQWAAGVKGTF